MACTTVPWLVDSPSRLGPKGVRPAPNLKSVAGGTYPPEANTGCASSESSPTSRVPRVRQIAHSQENPCSGVHRVRAFSPGMQFNPL